MSDSRESVTGQCIAEFLGTGLFMFRHQRAVRQNWLAPASVWEICIVWGLGIALAVYLTAGSPALILTRRSPSPYGCSPALRRRKWRLISSAQMAGAFCGAALTYLLYHNLFADYEQAHQMVRGSQDSLYLASIFSTYPAASISVWLAALVEIVITSMLIGDYGADRRWQRCAQRAACTAADRPAGGGHRCGNRPANRICHEPGS